MRNPIRNILAITSIFAATAVQAAVVDVVVQDNGSNMGVPGTFYWALTNCNANDTIEFHIPGPAGKVHYLQSPPGGWPLIYQKHGLTINGYTQNGAAPNSNPMFSANNAQIKIVLDAREGFGRIMDNTWYDGTPSTSVPPINNTLMLAERGGYDNQDEWAILGVYRSTNVTIKGLAFLGDNFLAQPNSIYCIAFAHDYGLVLTNRPGYINPRQAALAYPEGSDANGHVAGCWFGVDPTNPTPAGVVESGSGVAFFRHRNAGGADTRPELPNVGMTIGVKKGSTNPRSEFNVFVGQGLALAAECSATRVSGNFWGVLPDGVSTYFPINFEGGQFELGRYDDNLQIGWLIGTDGDGVNDAEEGNLFGPLDLQLTQMSHYSLSRKSIVIAGNRFGIDVNGNRWSPEDYIIIETAPQNGGQVRFGTDGNGVSDDLEANHVYNLNVFASLYPTPAGNIVFPLIPGLANNPGLAVQKDGWLSVRGNIMVNNWPVHSPDDDSGTWYVMWWTNYMNVPLTIADTIPTLSGSSTITSLIGSTLPPYLPQNYTNIMIDVYQADPEGLANGALFGGVSFPTGFPQGKKYFGGCLDNGPYDSNPAVGAFTLNTTKMNIPPGTKVTVTATYCSFVRTAFTGISRSAGTTTLTWTNPNGREANGGPYVNANGGPTGGFGIQRASSILGPWTTVAYTDNNTVSIADAAGTSFYRVVQPIAGQTTLFSSPVTLP